MQLFSLNHILEGLKPLHIDSSRCSRCYSPLSDCRICQDICPSHALTFTGDLWQADDCQNCGLCVAACPAQVFSLEESDLLSSAGKGDALAISCRHETNAPQGQLQISCFGQLYPELIFRLLQQASSLTIHYNSQTCTQCPNQWIDQSLLLQLEQYHLPLDRLFLVDASQKEDVHFSSSRRSFLRNIFSQTKTASQKVAALSAETLMEQLGAQAPAEIIAKRVHLANLYRQSDDLDLTQELPYWSLTNDHCTFCEACSKLCPTEALSVHSDENGVKSLLFQPILCNQCNICTTVCISKGLYWSDKLTIKQLLEKTPQTLAKSTKAICTQCGQDFWQFPSSEETICHFCQRQAH